MLTSLVVLVLASVSIASPTLEKRAITCLRVGQTATASWTNSAGKRCTFTGVVGSNYGANPSGSGDAGGGASDPNCGAAFNAAVDDTALGFANGCSQTNPSNGVAKPNGAPVCV
ncbi:hypothetical protein ACHAPM_002806 [Fusarium culmorum]|uniref:DUF8213 domain-containing protein n=1 Tax=Fusarium austroamericanum TaxID=282268 RepID=A0AAN5Z2P4_FUSAU|nr:hypothetical protein FAUST_9474 [Fusarium austroamericanum]